MLDSNPHAIERSSKKLSQWGLLSSIFSPIMSGSSLAKHHICVAAKQQQQLSMLIRTYHKKLHIILAYQFVLVNGCEMLG